MVTTGIDDADTIKNQPQGGTYKFLPATEKTLM